DPLYSSLWTPVPEIELEAPIEDFVKYFGQEGPTDPFLPPRKAKDEAILDVFVDCAALIWGSKDMQK
ncbi:unnamed protein product, partial [Prorocentrum cordatum]